MMWYNRGGTIFTDRTVPRGRWERTRLGSSLGLADSTFPATRGFSNGVAESGEFDIHFRLPAAITTPRVKGTITLDTLAFVMRRAAAPNGITLHQMFGT